MNLYKDDTQYICLKNYEVYNFKLKENYVYKMWQLMFNGELALSMNYLLDNSYLVNYKAYMREKKIDEILNS